MSMIYMSILTAQTLKAAVHVHSNQLMYNSFSRRTQFLLNQTFTGNCYNRKTLEYDFQGMLSYQVFSTILV